MKGKGRTRSIACMKSVKKGANEEAASVQVGPNVLLTRSVHLC